MSPEPENIIAAAAPVLSIKPVMSVPMKLLSISISDEPFSMVTPNAPVASEITLPMISITFVEATI